MDHSMAPVDNGDPGPADPPMAETLETMRAVLKRRFGIDEPNLEATRELSTLGLDSLAFVEYTFELESDLHIVLPDVPRELATVGDLARFIHDEVIRQAKGRPAQ